MHLPSPDIPIMITSIKTQYSRTPPLFRPEPIILRLPGIILTVLVCHRSPIVFAYHGSCQSRYAIINLVVRQVYSERRRQLYLLHCVHFPHSHFFLSNPSHNLNHLKFPSVCDRVQIRSVVGKRGAYIKLEGGTPSQQTSRATLVKSRIKCNLRFFHPRRAIVGGLADDGEVFNGSLPCNVLIICL